MVSQLAGSKKRGGSLGSRGEALEKALASRRFTEAFPGTANVWRCARGEVDLPLHRVLINCKHISSRGSLKLFLATANVVVKWSPIYLLEVGKPDFMAPTVS